MSHGISSRFDDIATKIQRRLRKFAQLAMDHQRPDIANSITAFNAGLEGILRSEMKKSRPAFVAAEASSAEEGE